MIRICTAKDFETIYEIINNAASVYQGIIPDDRWKDPYMSRDELKGEIADGVVFWGMESGGDIAGVMGIQDKGEVTLIRHAYVKREAQRMGIGGALLEHLQNLADKPILVGTWASASWAIDFYKKNGYSRVSTSEKDRLLRKYWSIPERQVETSVVLAKRLPQQVSQEDPVKAICLGRFEILDGDVTFQIPISCSHHLDNANPSIRKVVVVIHGAVRNADEYYKNMMIASELAGANADSTMVVAPQFLIYVDVQRHKLGNEMIFWNEQSWKQGYRCEPLGAHLKAGRISSYRVLDLLLERLSNGDTFPNLALITIAGHSAGGQFINRYAAGSPIGETLDRGGIPIRYIIANPSSYLYFTPERRAPGKMDQFTIPDGEKHTGYNQYHYGLENLNKYMGESPKDHIAARYISQNVIYLLGNEDTDSKGEMLDREPGALLQGAHRLERGLVYYNYLIHTFGEALKQNQIVRIIPGVGHDHAGIFQSVAGRESIFGE
jgi:N-acetylglutamate synthase-like GNAT family acetyltransferase